MKPDALSHYLTQHQQSFAELRQDIHQHPELSFKEYRTSELIADLLQDYGYTITKGIAKTGIIAQLKRGHGSKIIGIRADMDALPIQEETHLPYQSQNDGVMHACGHDGHTTIAIAAAKALAEQGDFNGTVSFIFQPAEEIGLGAKTMIKEGLFSKYPMDTIYGLHNWPNLTAGHFAFVPNVAMASIDYYNITIRGKGSHGAEPQNGIDPVTSAAYLITSLQTIVSRNVNPREMAVVTVGSIHGGNASNVIPDEVEIKLTVRAFADETRQIMKDRLQALVESIPQGFGSVATITMQAGFAAVDNNPDELNFARNVGQQVLGEANIDPTFQARTASEDFSFMLQQKQGAFLFVGNGDSAPLHNPAYDFNDAIIVPAARYWAGLTEAYLTGNSL